MLERLFDLSNVPFRNSIFRSVLPWEWLNEVIGFLNKKSLSMPWDVQELGSGIFVDPECSIHPTAIIEGPCYISKNVEIGPFCLIREGCLLLDACHLGHCVEVKHSILMPGATCGHRNYIGDSVIGRNVNFGDGSSIANMRADHDPDKTIQVEWNGKYCDTQLSKFGAIVGDGCSIGCRSTLNPGTVLGKDCLILCNVSVKGTHPPNTQFASPEAVVMQRKRV